MSNQSPTLRRRRLGHFLRSMRRKAGMTLDAAARATEIPRATLGRMETADARRLRREDLDALASVYGADQVTRETLHRLAEQAQERGWWSQYKDVLGSPALPDWESGAAQIRDFAALTVPGLLQTPDYAAAVFAAGNPDDEEVRRRVEARTRRREIFNRIEPPRMVAVIDEGALRRLIGGPEVMREQLTHLANMSLRHHVDIRVLPYTAGAHLALAGPFTIFDFPDPEDPSLVHVESVASRLVLESPEEVERYGAAFDDAQRAALSTERSAELLHDIRRSLESAG